MYKGVSLLGFIPARAGSKGVPGKNIRPLAGKPLIVYTIQTAKESSIFDCLVVSTDGEEIARIAREAGAEVPFLRPPELATDEARGIDALHHALKWFEERGTKFDCVMCLQPTSPLRSAADIVAAVDLLLARNAEAIVSVCQAEHHPWWTNVLPEDGCMKDFLKPGIPTNRQELPAYYRLNGAIYLARWDFIRNRDSWLGPHTYAYIMPRERSVDIDEEIDFKIAEVLLALSQ
ncbi:MAG: acylneuraminate cytidylyltransferase family protein [Desulforudis sp.]|jgi:N-acylneuraminate cytidylyltransferase/CMP-N,N'-diacetyllegionaminic acid synthase|nr:MAG: acylneuraminate cytidylyltransferase family protein [Desulforudis sp.]